MDRNSRINPSSSEENITCHMCGSSDVYIRKEEDSFEYGTGDSAVILKAVVDVLSCAECSIEYTGSEADEIRHEAVCHHLGLLTPREIRGVRGNMSKTEFSHLTGIDEEPIKKLERGFMLPNIVMDNFLYLLSLSENFEAIRRRRTSSEQT